MKHFNQITVVTPTFRRPVEVAGLLVNLARQTILPTEVILVDGAPLDETHTELKVAEIADALPFEINYIRHSGGTAIQRNVGVDAARGDFIALIDDDVRLEDQFLKRILTIFSEDENAKVGGIVGYRTNQHFTIEESQRWRWYQRLRLLTTYEPSRYDFECGYPINSFLQMPFSGTRPVDFVTTACAVWRRDVFDTGLRFDSFF